METKKKNQLKFDQENIRNTQSHGEERTREKKRARLDPWWIECLGALANCKGAVPKRTLEEATLPGLTSGIGGRVGPGFNTRPLGVGWRQNFEQRRRVKYGREYNDRRTPMTTVLGVHGARLVLNLPRLANVSVLWYSCQLMIDPWQRRDLLVTVVNPFSMFTV